VASVSALQPPGRQLTLRVQGGDHASRVGSGNDGERDNGRQFDDDREAKEQVFDQDRLLGLDPLCAEGDDQRQDSLKRTVA
jgi:hypothetical protein